MRSISHWTVKYILARLVEAVYRRRHPDYPWLTLDAIALLETWLQAADCGFEWGAGRSTLWLAGKVRHLTSIEHDPTWYAKVLQSLTQAKITNVNLQLRGLEGGEKSEYLRAIGDGAGVNPFDFVLVDGRLRHLCVLAALPRLRPGGLLILDNSDRYIPREATRRKLNGSVVEDSEGRWNEVLLRLNSWRSIVTTNGIWDTTLWVKPVEGQEMRDVDSQLNKCA